MINGQPNRGTAPLIFNLQGQDGQYNITYSSNDLLGNPENNKQETDWLDNTPPTIIIYNPSEDEATGIERCDQSIVVEVYDDGSGVDETSIYVELWTTGDMPVLKDTVYLHKAVYHGTKGAIYEGLMNKEYEAGTYMLKVHAKDNLGNSRVVDRQEVLTEGIYVEYLDPASCLINVGESKNCVFTFHVCARNVTIINMCMYKLGENPGLITPDMLNATISKGDVSAYVGLCNVSDAKDLQLSEGKINGKITFDLGLSFTSNITSILGTGNYDFNYTINWFDP
jgi:hypothetical protein